MCFITTTPNKLIATRNIVCYKEMGIINNVDCKSYWFNFPYTFNKLYKQDIRLSINKYQFDDRWFINQGYHSYHKNIFIICNKSKLVKCIIPNGAIYYKNESEYVSDRIIIKRKLNMFDIVLYKLKLNIC